MENPPSYGSITGALRGTGGKGKTTKWGNEPNSGEEARNAPWSMNELWRRLDPIDTLTNAWGHRPWQANIAEPGYYNMSKKIS